MKKILFLTLFSTVFASSFGQYSYFMKARILKTDSSTITGFVKKTSESSLNYGVKFINSTTDNDIREFSITDIDQLIFLDDSTVFEQVKYENYKLTNNTVKINEYRLAKKIVIGYADLYKLQLPENEWNIVFEHKNTFVYILKIDTNYYVLDQKEKLEGSDYRLFKNYIGVLRYILKDYPKLTSNIQNLKFNDKQIIPLIEKLNNEHSDISSKVLITKETPIIYHGPTISYAKLNNFINIEGSGYSLGYKASIILPEVNRHISSDIGFLMEQIFYTDLKNNKYNKLYFKVPIGLTYTFNNSKIAPFLSFAISPYFSNEFSEFFFGGSAGLTFYKKYLLSFSIDNKVSSEETDLKVHFDQILLLNIGYRFGTNKIKMNK